ncbi:MAG: GntR family transcriptional regulator [Anaerostipes sp.]|nr:GntR family transcriptional regulator [Anaerostipes sp.]
MNDLFTKNIMDKNSAIPLYFQLYSYLENLIKEGTLKEGDRLPGEEEMTALVGISRPTVRQAYKELSEKGYVKRRRSKGTIVTKPKVFNKFLSELTNFYNELTPEGIKVQTKVLKFEIVENAEETARILDASKLIHLVRLRYSDDIPVVYIESYLPYEEYKQLFQYDLEKESLYDKMEAIGNPLKSVRRNLTAVKAVGDIAAYLEMEKGDPILFSKTIGKNAQGKVVEYSLASYHSSYANFQIDLKI